MDAKKKILFIINPISGVGKKNTIPPLIEKYLDKSRFSFEIRYTQYRKHGQEIAFAEKDSFDAIVAVGGDGSVNEIGSALVNSSCALAIVPCGSGNGLARHACIPLKPARAIQRINQFKEEKIDVGKVNDFIFLGTCGFGFDAHIARKFDEYHKRGFVSYIRLVLREFRTYKPRTFRFTWNNQQIEKTALMCSVANSSQFGNGFTISPLSDLQDGIFELIFLKKMSAWKFPVTARKFFNGTIHQSKNFESFAFRDSLFIETTDNTSTFLHVDGEPAGSGISFSINIIKDGLRLI